MGFSSLWAGATGLKSHSTKMNVIGNNLANVNTVGFKNSTVHFQNLMSDEKPGGSPEVGTPQVGMGVKVAGVQASFIQGPIQPGTESTDLAIGGKGYFGVANDGEVHYTRAGNFRFNQGGYLVDPNGYQVQGHNIVDGVSSGTTDIQLNLNADNRVVIDAEATTSLTVMPNLGTDGDNSASASDPFFSMFKVWDGGGSNASAKPMAAGTYEFSHSLKIYDQNGTPREIDLYFDSVDVSNAGGNSYFEFLVGIDPAQDGRANFSGTSNAGLVMAGTLVFNHEGELVDMASYTYSGTPASGAGVRGLSAWTPSAMSTSGNPTFDVSFTNSSGASGGTSSISLDFGLEDPNAAWASGRASNAGGVGNDKTALASMGNATRSALAATAYTGSNSIIFQAQDGYAEGYLTSMSFDRAGVASGHFSNGINQDLFQLSVYDFPNQWGLRSEGANHYTATPASGDAIEGLPDDDQFGYIIGASLEQSNVDIARQFTDMIITERGFQANSKIITTTDWMLQTAVQLKR